MSDRRLNAFNCCFSFYELRGFRNLVEVVNDWNWAIDRPMSWGYCPEYRWIGTVDCESNRQHFGIASEFERGSLNFEEECAFMYDVCATGR